MSENPATGETPAMLGPYTRPLGRDPALWVTAAVVVLATAVSGWRAWSESSSLGNAAAVGALSFALTSISTVFVVTVLVGIPRGWRAGRSGRRR